jgi:Ca2+-binding EF-hand superfamily protein
MEGDNTHEEDIITTFKLFDSGNQGSFTRESLQDVLGRLGNVLTEEILDNIMKAADPNGTGTINQEAFVGLFS